MKKLKLQFIFFFILLQTGIGFLLLNSYRQIRIEEKSFWQAQAAKVFNQMQAQISEMLNKEDARSFKEYRFLMQNKQQSPISIHFNSNTAPKALVGYFQMEPNADLSTPYLPLQKTLAKNLDDYKTRLAKQEKIAQSTAAFRDEMKALFRSKTGFVASPIQKNAQSTRLTLPETLASDTEESLNQSNALSSQKLKSSANIYPNPISSKQFSPIMKDSSIEEKKEQKAANEAPASLARREELAPSQELKEFKQHDSSQIFSSTLTPRSKKEKSVVWIDPFQASLSGSYLIFYRRVWVEEGLYLQGFVLDTKLYFENLMENIFENSELPQFTNAAWMSNGKWMSEYGQALSGDSKVLYSRFMYYPLNKLEWKIRGKDWPKTSTRMYLNLFSFFLFLFSSAGLYWIYRSSAVQVKLSQKRQDFVSAITHELKTPLTAIQLYSEMLENEWLSHENKRKEYIHNIHQESSRLSRLIENVLQMARLEKQKYKFHLSLKNPIDDLEKWEKELSLLAKQSGFDFKLHLPNENLPSIRYESDALKEVLLILLENSLKFGKQSANKNLSLELENHRNKKLYFVWKDNGPGVPKEELKSIFEKFYRVESELTRKTKGTGIGLSIAKAILEGMGASIEAHPNPSGGLQMKIGFIIFT